MRDRHCQSTPGVEATHPDCGIFPLAERDQEVGQSPKEPMPSATVKAAKMRVVQRPTADRWKHVDKVEPHNLEDKVLAFIRNIAPGQTPAPALGSSNQSTTSSSHGGSDSYPDLNNNEYAAQWGQDWNAGDADTSGGSDGELYGLQKGKGKGKSGSFNGICYNCGKSGHSAKFCYARGGKAKVKGKKGDTKGWNDGKGWTFGMRWSEGQRLEHFRQRLGATKGQQE